MAGKEGKKAAKVSIQRYKGLGEMNADELWETTMDPERRILKQVNIDDAQEADKVFDMLMGTDVPARKSFIQSNAKMANLISEAILKKLAFCKGIGYTWLNKALLELCRGHPLTFSLIWYIIVELQINSLRFGFSGFFLKKPENRKAAQKTYEKYNQNHSHGLGRRRSRGGFHHRRCRSFRPPMPATAY